MGKVKGGAPKTMAALQEGRSGEMGQSTRGGGADGSGTPSNSSSISSKFHNRPGGGEISQVTNKGDGLTK